MRFIVNTDMIYWNMMFNIYEFLSTPDSENLNTNTKEISEKSKVSMKGLSRSSLDRKSVV